MRIGNLNLKNSEIFGYKLSDLLEAGVFCLKIYLNNGQTFEFYTENESWNPSEYTIKVTELQKTMDELDKILGEQ